MKYNQPFGITDVNAPYINGNPSTGTMGSIPPAESIEYPQREIVELIADSGYSPSNSDLKQLAKSVQLQRVNFGIDAGTVNNLQITLAPVPVYKNGLIVRVLAVQSNTGPSVLNANALGPKKIRRPGDTDVLANDITAGTIGTYVYNEALQAGAGAFEMQGLQASNTGAGGYMTKNLDLYVNYALGNDANDGTANDAVHAVKNIQKAIDIAWNYRPSQYTLTIHIADSQFYTAFATPTWAGPNLAIVGNLVTPSNVLVSGMTGPTRHACAIAGNQAVVIKGIKVTMPTTVGNQGAGFWVGNGAVVTLEGNESAFCDGFHVYSGYGGNINIVGSHRIAGGSNTTILTAAGGAYLTSAGCAYTFVTASSAQYFVLNSFSYVEFNAGTTSFVSPGNFTGQRYIASANGIIATLGGGANFFPGTIAGAVQLGGQYI